MLNTNAFRGSIIVSSRRTMTSFANKMRVIFRWRFDKKGHLARVCRSRRSANGSTPARVKAQRFSHHPHRSQQSGNTQPTHTIRESTVESDSEDTALPLFKVGRKALRPIVVTLNVSGQRLPMEVDTGAAVSIISAGTKEELSQISS